MQRNRLLTLAMAGALAFGAAVAQMGAAFAQAPDDNSVPLPADQFVTDPAYLGALDSLDKVCAAIADSKSESFRQHEIPIAVDDWNAVDAILETHGGLDEERSNAATEVARLKNATDPLGQSVAANDLSGSLTELYGVSTTHVPEGAFRLPFLLRRIRFAAREKDWSGAAAVADDLGSSWNDVTTEARDRGVAVSLLTPLDTATGALPPMISRRDLRSIELAVPVDLAGLAAVRKALAATVAPKTEDGP